MNTLVSKSWPSKKTSWRNIQGFHSSRDLEVKVQERMELDTMDHDKDTRSNGLVLTKTRSEMLHCHHTRCRSGAVLLTFDFVAAEELQFRAPNVGFREEL